MDFIDETFVLPVQALVENSKTLIDKCEKPTLKDFQTSVKQSLLGFFVLGMIGVAIKVIFIPVNSVIMGK